MPILARDFGKFRNAKKNNAESKYDARGLLSSSLVPLIDCISLTAI
jgi:hypothetical protein